MQRVEVQLEDDLTGGPADQTVAFSVDGRDYEIDLSAAHAADLRRQLARFVERARMVRTRRSSATRTAASRERTHQIRAWAEQRGYTVAERGRLPRNIIHEYELASTDEQHAERPKRRRSGDRKTAPQLSSKKPQRRR